LFARRYYGAERHHIRSGGRWGKGVRDTER
jgi:hypothetical protein